MNHPLRIDPYPLVAALVGSLNQLFTALKLER